MADLELNLDYFSETNTVQTNNKSIQFGDDNTKSQLGQKNISSFRKNNHGIPWVDKYRPKSLDDIVNQDHVVTVLKDTLKSGNLPHLLLHGPPGLGKTSIILAFARQLFGPKYVDERVIELNASDERGINVVRYKIIKFAKTAIGNHDPNYPSPPYKIIILDEADAMTNEAQSALRIVMEEMSEITRFCFICNYINQIIDPIASRCQKFRFKPINKENMHDKLKLIADNEKLDLTDDVINAVEEVVKGDMRKGIMTLQNLKYIYNYKNKVTIYDVYEMAGCVPIEYIKPVMSMCMDKNTQVKNIIKEAIRIKRNGFPVSFIIQQMSKFITNSDQLNDKQKADISIQFGITERRLYEGADEYLQLVNLYGYILGVVQNRIGYITTCLC